MIATKEKKQVKRVINIDYQPYPKQEIFHAAAEAETVYGGAKGGGKALSLDTLIPTPDGWTTMGDIKPGDTVFGVEGEIQTVLATSGIMHDRKCYKLTFDDNTEVVADEGHLWHTYTANEREALYKRTDEYRERRRKIRKLRGKGKRNDLALWNKNNPPETKEAPQGALRTTEEIARTLITRNDGLRNHVVINTKELELPEADLPLNPYVLGVWLGDGSKEKSEITTADIEIIDYIEKAGFLCRKKPNKYGYTAYGLITALRSLGINSEKAIPNMYLRASAEQRLELIKGLMDTDGHARKHGGVEFTSTNLRLAEGLKELVVSMGWKTTVKEGKATLNGKYISPKYRVVFTPDRYVFRLKRKIEKQKLTRSPITGRRVIVECKEVESVPVQCIKVTGGMFLCTKNMIPTHNSAALVMDAVAYAMAFKRSKVYLFRRTYDELEAKLMDELLTRVPERTKEEWGPYKLDKQSRIATFWNGSRIYFRYIANYKDAKKYAGREMDYIGVDELTEHEERSIQILLSCLRSPLGHPPRFKGTCNPGGIGHAWVYKRYIEPTDYGKKTYKEELTENLIRFVPATVYDNLAIMKNDPVYVKRLKNLPPSLREAFLNGNWHIFEGQMFEEWRYDIHTCKPFAIPKHWKRWRAADNGRTDPFAWYWLAVDEDGNVYCYREYTREYRDKKIEYSDQASQVSKMSILTDYNEYDEEIPIKDEAGRTIRERIDFSVVGHDAFNVLHGSETGKTIIDYYIAGGINDCISSVRDRALRSNTLHEYLKPFWLNSKMRYKARLTIFRNCTKLIETLPQQIKDEKNPEAYAETDYDHWTDGLGYGLVAHHCKKSNELPETMGQVKTLKEKLIKEQQRKKRKSRYF